MSSRPTVGIMITKDDADVAAWFNMMKGHNPAKWVSGMLAAWSMGEKLESGSIVLNEEVEEVVDGRRQTDKFGYGHFGSSIPVPASNRKYGWTVKGPDGTYIEGSVINLSVARQEIQPIISALKANHTQLAPFIKSLIRSNITIASEQKLPDISALTSVMARYRLKTNAQPKPETQPSSKPKPEAIPMKSSGPSLRRIA